MSNQADASSRVGDARETTRDETTEDDGRSALDGSLTQRLRAVYENQIGPTEKALLHSWAAFGATFGVTRALTHVLRWRSGGGGSGGITIAGRHLHHYNLGILILAVVGGVAVHGQEHRRQHPLTAAAYGTGAALIVDELALLIDLSDVYWANDGRASVDAAVGLIGLSGVTLAAVPLWQGIGKELFRSNPRTSQPAN